MNTKLLLLFGLLSASSLRGQDLIESDFTGTDLANNLPVTATTQIAPGLASSGWDFWPGLTPFDGIDDRIAFLAPSDDTASTLAEAVAEDEYLTITLTPDAEITLTEQRFSFSIRRFTYNAPRRYAVFSSVAGFGEGDAIFASELIANGAQDPVDLSFIIPDGHETVSGPVEFRIYIYEALHPSNHPTSLGAFSITDPGEVFALSATADASAEVVVTPDSQYFETGASVEVLAVAPEGMRFAGWDGDASSGFNPIRVVMDADTEINATFVPRVTGEMEFGTNLQPVDYFSSAWVFVDGMKNANTWASQSNESEERPEVPVDENGWPLQAPFDPGDGINYRVSTIVHVPMSGEMTVTFEGTGTIRFQGQNVVAGQAPLSGAGEPSTHQVEFALQPGIATNATMNIDYSDPEDPIRNIKIHVAGFDESTTFHPDYLEDLEPYTTLRFMDWGDTNSHTNGDWEERTKPDHFSQGTGAEGVAIEVMVELANTTGKDMWYCVPHLADDHYIEQAAILIRDQLGPHQKVYLEYSNETWNSARFFLQTYWVRQQGLDLGLLTNEREAGDKFQTMRMVRAWEIFKAVFAEAGPNRIIKVAGGWSSQPGNTADRLAYISDPALNPNGTTADAIAIAPYFGRGIDGNYLEDNGYPTADEIVTTMSITSIEEEREDMQEHRQNAANAGVRLIAYEGGQHFLNGAGAQQDETLTAIVREAQSDPRMGERYTEYLDMLRDEGMEFFVNFTLTQYWSRSGYFSIYEYQNQPLEDAPKAEAVLNWIEANPISQPKVPDLQIDSNTKKVLFSTEKENFYTLETSSDMRNWEITELQFISGNGELQMHSFEADEPRRFWRVRVE